MTPLSSPLSPEAMACELESLAQNDYNIDGRLLPSGERLVAIATALRSQAAEIARLTDIAQSWERQADKLADIIEAVAWDTDVRLVLSEVATWITERRNDEIGRLKAFMDDCQRITENAAAERDALAAKVRELEATTLPDPETLSDLPLPITMPYRATVEYETESEQLQGDKDRELGRAVRWAMNQDWAKFTPLYDLGTEDLVEDHRAYRASQPETSK